MTISIDSIRYPLSLERCGGNVGYDTTILELGNGSIVAVANWEDGLVHFNAAHGVRSLTDLRTLLSFHRRRKGRARGFLVRDLLDYEVARGTEGTFATGDGTAGPFQLSKTYADAYNSDVRPITRPEQGTVKIYVNNVLKTEGVHYTISYTTGKVTFTAGNFPTVGATLEWSGRFFVPVHFAEDRLPLAEFLMNMEDDGTGEQVVKAGAGDLPEILMIEVR
ncbi:MAG TPA: DUF2460 domain-containing protein [Pyrinomonadaceae bacterium]|nr:DUF2460 domain-containing protein [Pyrinomonadaceae bacterium]